MVVPQRGGGGIAGLLKKINIVLDQDEEKSIELIER